MLAIDYGVANDFSISPQPKIHINCEVFQAALEAHFNSNLTKLYRSRSFTMIIELYFRLLNSLLNKHRLLSTIVYHRFPRDTLLRIRILLRNLTGSSEVSSSCRSWSTISNNNRVDFIHHIALSSTGMTIRNQRIVQ